MLDNTVSYGDLWQRGHERWSAVCEVHCQVFSSYCAERDVDAARAVADDLYLACACSLGADGALTAFDRYCTGAMRAALAPMALSSATRDDVLQMVREKLFVGQAIATYRGRGSLQGWLRAVCVRVAIDHLRSEGKQALPTDGELLEAFGGTANVDSVSDELRDRVEACICAAFASLDKRQRTLLRQHHLHGMSIDQIGAVYGVHRVTAFRWLASARSQILAVARRALKEPSRADADELIAAVISRLDITLTRLLASEHERA